MNDPDDSRCYPTDPTPGMVLSIFFIASMIMLFLVCVAGSYIAYLKAKDKTSIKPKPNKKMLEQMLSLSNISDVTSPRTVANVPEPPTTNQLPLSESTKPTTTAMEAKTNSDEITVVTKSEPNKKQVKWGEKLEIESPATETVLPLKPGLPSGLTFDESEEKDSNNSNDEKMDTTSLNYVSEMTMSNVNTKVSMIDSIPKGLTPQTSSKIDYQGDSLSRCGTMYNAPFAIVSTNVTDIVGIETPHTIIRSDTALAVQEETTSTRSRAATMEQSRLAANYAYVENNDDQESGGTKQKGKFDDEVGYGKITHASTILGCCCDKKFIVYFFKFVLCEIRKKRKCYYPFVSHIIDQATDIAVIIKFYQISQFENKHNFDCPNINGTFLFSLSVGAFCLYGLISCIWVYNVTKSKFHTLLQVFDLKLYHAMYMNFVRNKQDPSNPQRFLQILEASLESFPQCVIQLYYLIVVGNRTNDSTVTTAFITFSLIFSIINISFKIISEDKVYFEKDWQSIEFSSADCSFNYKYLIRLFIRFADLIHRLLLILLSWIILGGTVVFVYLVCEFLALYSIASHQKRYATD